MSQPMRSSHEAASRCSGPPPQGLPRSTGEFKLFDLPRELRDKIYYYHLYRPGGVYYTAHADLEFWLNNRVKSGDISNLLTVSRQVYNEAFEVFCLANTVALSTQYNSREGYKKQLTGLLRLFPDRAAANLTRVSNTYRDVVVRPVGGWGYAPSHRSIADGGDGTGRYQKRNSAGQTFIEILRDAYLLKQFFPKLLVFEAQWYPEPPFHEYPEQPGPVSSIACLLEKGTDVKDIVALWLEVMSGWIQGQNVVLLNCVGFSLKGFAADGFGHQLDTLMNEAYRALVKERMIEEDIEDSGRKWLEEMDRNQTARRKKSRKKPAEQS